MEAITGTRYLCPPPPAGLSIGSHWRRHILPLSPPGLLSHIQMYILLNIKDSDRASQLISLLFKNGFNQMITGNELKDVCSQCANRETISHKSSRQSEVSTDQTWLKRSLERERTPSTSTKNQLESLIDFGGISVEGLLSAKDEPYEDDLSMEQKKLPDPVPLKRSVKRKAAREEKEGQQGLHCNYCHGYITWGGSTPVANIERHVKLHASRNQFSCSQCEYTCSRRYQVKSHITASHPPHIPGNNAQIIDHGPSLRVEYDSLWGLCFPDLDIAEYRANKKEYLEKKKRFEFDLLPKKDPEEEEEEEREELDTSDHFHEGAISITDVILNNALENCSALESLDGDEKSE